MEMLKIFGSKRSAPSMKVPCLKRTWLHALEGYGMGWKGPPYIYYVYIYIYIHIYKCIYIHIYIYIGILALCNLETMLPFCLLLFCGGISVGMVLENIEAILLSDV